MFFLCWLKMIIIFVHLSKHTQLGTGCFSSVHRHTVCTLYSYSVCSLFAVYRSVSLFWPQCLKTSQLWGRTPAQCSNTWLGYNLASQPVMLATFSIFRVGWWGCLWSVTDQQFLCGVLNRSLTLIQMKRPIKNDLKARRSLTKSLFRLVFKVRSSNYIPVFNPNSAFIWIKLSKKST